MMDNGLKNATAGVQSDPMLHNGSLSLADIVPNSKNGVEAFSTFPSFYANNVDQIVVPDLEFDDFSESDSDDMVLVYHPMHKTSIGTSTETDSFHFDDLSQQDLMMPIHCSSNKVSIGTSTDQESLSRENINESDSMTPSPSPPIKASTSASTDFKSLSLEDISVPDSGLDIRENVQKCYRNKSSGKIDNKGSGEPSLFETQLFDDIQEVRRIKLISTEETDIDESPLLLDATGTSDNDSIISKLQQLATSHEKEVEHIQKEIEKSDFCFGEEINTENQIAESFTSWFDVVNEDSHSPPPKTVFMDLRPQSKT